MAKVFIAAEMLVESRLLPINAFETSKSLDCWHGIEDFLESHRMDPYGFDQFLPLNEWGFSVTFSHEPIQ